MQEVDGGGILGGEPGGEKAAEDEDGEEEEAEDGEGLAAEGHRCQFNWAGCQNKRLNKTKRHSGSFAAVRITRRRDMACRVGL